MQPNASFRRLVLSKEERSELRRLALGQHVGRRLMIRAQIVLACEQRKSYRQIARELRVTEETARKWCMRFATLRLGGLIDKPRSGAPRWISDEIVETVVKQTLAERTNSPPEWTSRRLADSLSVSQSTVIRIWRNFGLVRS